MHPFTPFPMRTLRHPWVLLFVLLVAPTVLVAQPPMVTKYLYEFDTLGSGHPNDLINDQPALLKAAAFFQARGGYGTLILEGGEYIVGVQELHWATDPLPGPDWIDRYYSEGSIQGSSRRSAPRAMRPWTCITPRWTSPAAGTSSTT